MDSNELLYVDLPCNTFAQRLKKAKLIARFTQKSLAATNGLSPSTINELEARYRNYISRNSLIKLLVNFGVGEKCSVDLFEQYNYFVKQMYIS